MFGVRKRTLVLRLFVEIETKNAMLRSKERIEKNKYTVDLYWRDEMYTDRVVCFVCSFEICVLFKENSRGEN